MIKTKKKPIAKEVIAKNIKQLQIGSKYSYPKFCKALGINEGNYNTKKKNMNLILELIEYEEEGTQHIVKGFKNISEDEIKELTKDKRGTSANSRGNNSKYNNALVNTMIYGILNSALMELSNKNNTNKVDTMQQDDFMYKKDNILHDDNNTISIKLTKHDIACGCGIRNRWNYNAYRNTPNYFNKYFDIDPNVSEFLFPSINNKSYSTVNSLINSLSNQGLAVVSEEMEIDVVSTYDENGNFLDDEIEEDRLEIEKNRRKKKYMKAIATEEQRLAIEVIRLEVAKKMGYKNLAQVYNLGTQSDIQEFHKKLNRLSARRFKIYNSRPYLKLTTSIELIKTHLMKFEHMTIDEFLSEGHKAYLQSSMDKVIYNMNLGTDVEERRNRFEKLKSVKSNKGKEIKIFYNTIQRKEGYIEQAESFIDKITNTLAPIIPSKDNDIPKKEDVKKSSIEVFRENSSIVEKIEEEVISYYDNDFNLDDLNNL